MASGPAPVALAQPVSVRGGRDLVPLVPLDYQALSSLHSAFLILHSISREDRTGRMKFSSTFALGALLSVVSVMASDVIDLTANTFDDEIVDEPLALVE